MWHFRWEHFYSYNTETNKPRPESLHVFNALIGPGMSTEGRRSYNISIWGKPTLFLGYREPPLAALYVRKMQKLSAKPNTTWHV